MTAAAVPPPDSSPPLLTHRSAWSDLLDLLASMRFSISLLTVICIASAIGTVLQQAQPLVNYVDAFGPFWTEVFGALGLFRIYSSPWFLAILAFLVISTSLCIARNVPKILVDLRTFKENIRWQALDAFHHKAQGTLAQPLAAAQQEVAAKLGALGWHIKAQARTGEQGGVPGVMIAARRGAANKLGYIAAHSAIVLVCLGGLFDGDLIVKVQAWSQGLQPFSSGQPAERSRLSVDNPAYRAQLFVPEGHRSGAAVLNLDQGMLVQPLPFEVELKKFIVDYYSTGMPKRFASEIVVHDARDDSTHAATVEVNKPFVYDGVTIFQSSFEDGGSQVQLKPWSMLMRAAGAAPAVIAGEVGAAGRALPLELSPAGPLTLEVTGLRVINVEDLSSSDRNDGRDATSDAATSAAGTDTRGVNLQALTEHLGSGAKAPGDKKLVNIGPSVTYKLRDSAGQAREYQNYMVPVTLGGQPVFLLGVRENTGERFRFLRVPADEEMSLTGWWRLRQALADPALRDEAARRFARQGGADADAASELTQQLTLSAQRVLDLFAGARLPPDMPQRPGVAPGGLISLSDFIDQVVPEADRERTSGTLIRILNGALFELLNLSRERAGLPAMAPDAERTNAFMTQAVLSLSDATAYPAPAVFMLDGFEQRQASVFQVTRTPGRNVVYLGCILLIVGVFAMLYVRERRVWVWLHDTGSAGGALPATGLKMALSCTRQTLDTDAEFDRLRQVLLPDSAAPAAPPSSPAPAAGA